MSAPWEVLLREDTTGGHSNWETTVYKKDSVRYLRADLTCGECALFMKSECPKDALCGRNGTLEPACMAFVPRKETP